MSIMREIFFGVYEHEGKILTKNRVPGRSVYGEPLIRIGGKEYRVWDPRRSKLAAAIKNGLKTWAFREGVFVLYLGIAEGTTASHISDIIGDSGVILGVDISPRVMPKLIQVAEERENILPVLADANHPEEYEEYVKELGKADILYEDVAQPNQADILLKNARFLKKGGYAYFAVKARSIDVTKDPEDIFDAVEEQLKKTFKILERIRLEPYEKDHAMFVLKKR